VIAARYELNLLVFRLILVFTGPEFDVSCSLKALQEKAKIIRELF
jgi:hypothetical protein